MKDNDSRKPGVSALRRLLPTCRDVSRLQSVAAGESLPLARRLGLQLHLLVCSWCRRYGKSVRFLRSAVHEEAEQDTTGGNSLSIQARERLKRALQEGSD